LESASISIFDAINWANDTPVGLAVRGMRQPVRRRAFVRKYGRGERIFNEDTYFIRNWDSHGRDFNGTAIRYTTGGLGLDTLTLYFEKGRLVFARYYPSHHDVIKDWEMPWLMSLGMAITSGAFVLIALFITPVLLYVALSLFEGRKKPARVE
jgi:hypothetical protein